jgi:hypothetical protein
MEKKGRDGSDAMQVSSPTPDPIFFALLFRLPVRISFAFVDTL